MTNVLRQTYWPIPELHLAKLNLAEYDTPLASPSVRNYSITSFSIKSWSRDDTISLGLAK